MKVECRLRTGRGGLLRITSDKINSGAAHLNVRRAASVCIAARAALTVPRTSYAGKAPASDPFRAVRKAAPLHPHPRKAPPIISLRARSSAVRDPRDRACPGNRATAKLLPDVWQFRQNELQAQARHSPPCPQSRAVSPTHRAVAQHCAGDICAVRRAKKALPPAARILLPDRSPPPPPPLPPLRPRRRRRSRPGFSIGVHLPHAGSVANSQTPGRFHSAPPREGCRLSARFPRWPNPEATPADVLRVCAKNNLQFQ